jgi:S-adenosylmethionine:tRNA ribosyltransferase-isomerase
LHFTPELVARLGERGIRWVEVTLHVGLDTFRPVSVERIDDHRMHGEWWSVPDETAQAIADTRSAGRRTVAVGTTTARTLEAFGADWDSASPKGGAGTTQLFIRPGHRWRLVDAMLTNFHLPRSTLLMMVSSMAGRSLMREAYETAISHRYRFYSFGDAMLIR